MKQFFRLMVAALSLSTLVSAGPASASAGAPTGSFDTASIRLGPSENLHQMWAFYGWAADPDTPGQSLRVHLYVDGVFDAEIETGYGRPDVERAVPHAGSSSGWQWRKGFSDEDAHTICAYAINTGGPDPNTTLGCKVTPHAASTAGDPMGHLDAAEVAPGLVRIRGWAGDPDSPSTFDLAGGGREVEEMRGST